MSFFYLATPYSVYTAHPGLDYAYRLACEQAALLAKSGIPVYSPIAETHGIATHGGIDPLDHQFWMDRDKPFMQAAGGLIMLMAERWEESRGMAMEMLAFEMLGKPVWFMEPGVIPERLKRARH